MSWRIYVEEPQSLRKRGEKKGGQRHPPTYSGVCPLGAFVHHGPMEQDTLKVRPVGIPSGLAQPMAWFRYRNARVTTGLVRAA